MAQASRPSAQVVPLHGAGGRPYPPKDLLEETRIAFAPAPDVCDWAFRSFIVETAALMNPVHEHLRDATIGFLWTNAPNSRQQRRIVGQAELGQPQGSMGKWLKGRLEHQITGWFGYVPDFLITLDAEFSAEADHATFCALVEHELGHCAQEIDAYGAPKFHRDGTPKFAMRGHDVESFVFVAERYGAVEMGVKALVEAARKPPSIGQARLDWLCGACRAAA